MAVLLEMQPTVVIWLLACAWAVHGAKKPMKYQCSTLPLSKGRVFYKHSGKIARFVCWPGYKLIGDTYNYCLNGKWDNKVSVCARPGCSKVDQLKNGWTLNQLKGAYLQFDCSPGYNRSGPSSSYCDGQRWSENLPQCLKSDEDAATECDFEQDTCGWQQDVNHDFDWRRKNFRSASTHLLTGPSYDHTKGSGADGYYMYIEASSRKPNDTARLVSPVYPSTSTESCFTFYFHMFGASVGTLRVYMRLMKEAYDTRKLNWLFDLSGNQGDGWHRQDVQIDVARGEFQLIIEGIRGDDYTSDIAIDDVRLGSTCPPQEGDADYTSPAPYTQERELCDGRCGETLSTCDCTSSCLDSSNCCLGYEQYCAFTRFTDFEITETTEVTRLSDPTDQLSTSAKPIQEESTQPPNASTRLPDTTERPSNAPKLPTKTTLLPTTSKRPSKKPDEPKPPYQPVTTPNQPKTSFTPTQLLKQSTKLAYTTNPNDEITETDALVSAFLDEPNRRLYVIGGSALALIVLSIMSGFVLFQRCRNYRNQSPRSDSCSDVRFLASDELLNFNLRTADC